LAQPSQPPVIEALTPLPRWVAPMVNLASGPGCRPPAAGWPRLRHLRYSPLPVSGTLELSRAAPVRRPLLPDGGQHLVSEVEVDRRFSVVIERAPHQVKQVTQGFERIVEPLLASWSL
jgi:hypothetical protein